jgi:hypothetical protein
MSEKRQTDRDCEPTKDPAGQPKPPGDGTGCTPLVQVKAPDLKEPKVCHDPPEDCSCLPKPTKDTTCLQKLIDKQAADILAAEKAKTFKTELEKVLDAAKKASLAYTSDKYKTLLEEWVRQDAAIAELLRKLECAVPCWSCILDCYLCPLLNDLLYAKQYLYNDGKLCTDVHDLYDMQYWHQRNKAAKQRTFDRIAGVIAAWSDPAKTIEATLNANKALIDSAGKVIGQTAGQALYDVFVLLVQRHLLIAPPATDATTKIDKKYTEYCMCEKGEKGEADDCCTCDKGEADDCCGPDVGEWSLRRQLAGGALPYLIHPKDYFALICCLVEQRYAPAKEALSTAETALAGVTDQITRYETQLKNGWVKVFETAAKAAIPSSIDCCDYDKDEETTQQQS